MEYYGPPTQYCEAVKKNEPTINLYIYIAPQDTWLSLKKTYCVNHVHKTHNRKQNTQH